MIKSVDMVIVVSKNLYNSKHLYNKHTYIVPNAVDYCSYLKASKSSTPLPKDIALLPLPIIGYSGLISKRLNLKMIKEIADTHPEWSIALIGTVDDTGCVNKLVDLKKSKNVFFLGEKNIDELPFYVSAFDVCIIPYEINDETKNLNPLKLYDFMATGKPIVTTNIPAAQEYKKFIYLVNSSENISKYINKALNEKNCRKKEERIMVASMNTWDHRVETLSNLIEMKIDCKNPTNVLKNDSIRCL
jgi:glycosyltransferase involved in cell wall biosynthesis